MLKICDLKFPLQENDKHVYTYLELVDFITDKLINVYHAENVRDCVLIKKSLDARHGHLSYILSATFNADNELALIRIPSINTYEPAPNILDNIKPSNEKVVVVGMGPAGLFCSYILAKAGARVTLIEQGEQIEKRVKDVENFFNGGALKSHSNIQFGEGGAGTFSDGKLTTGISSPFVRFVLETFVKFGASPEILYEAFPHVGTDVLRKVIVNMREELLNLGVRILYKTKLVGFSSTAVEVINDGLPCNLAYEKLVLATGHSADDVYTILKNKGCKLEQKSFAVGVRIEHLAKDINYSMYHGNYPNLPAANYKLVTHLSSGRVVYTFCMCPGGEVVNASSSDGCLVINGMSYNARNNINSNSALLVNVDPSDFDQGDVLDGVRFQKNLEKAAYNVARGKVPTQSVGSFLNNTQDLMYTKVTPSVRSGYVYSNLNDLLPPFVSASLKEALPLMGNKIKGFDDEKAILSAVESRSSAPVKVVRNEELQTSLANVYCAGEGSGYAGGITTSAIDGIKIAIKIIGE